MEKLKVGDIAKTLGIDPQTVREWSAQFSNFLSEDANPPRGATRYYNEDDLNALTFVYKLRRNDATFQEISEALTLEQHRFTMPNLIVRGDSPLSGLGSNTGIIKTSDIEQYIRLEGQLEEVRGERDYLRGALHEERKAHSVTMDRAARAEAERDQRQLPPPAPVVVAPTEPSSVKVWRWVLVAALVAIVALLAVMTWQGMG